MSTIATVNLPPSTRRFRGWAVAVLAFFWAAIIGHGTSAQNHDSAPHSTTDSQFAVEFDRGAITSLRAANDSVETDYAGGQRLGDAAIRYRIAGADWRIAATAQLSESGIAEFTSGDNEHSATYRLATENDESDVVVMRTKFVVAAEAIYWTLTIENSTNDPVTISDISLPVSISRTYTEAESSKRILKHSFVSGHGSFLFWMRQNTVAPFLTLIPSKATSFEYWDYHGVPAAMEACGQNLKERGERRPEGAYNVYIHSAGVGDAIRQHGGRWRLPHSKLTLAPRGLSGDHRTYGYTLRWTTDYDDIRQMLADQGQLDVHVVPGMTVPSDLASRFAIRSNDCINSVAAEFPNQTQLDRVGENGDYDIYSVSFGRLGENRLTVNHGHDRRTFLEFFATEPLETLIKKRAAFIAKSQHRETSKWYNGLITDWNMRDHVLPSPDNYDLINGNRIYAVTCDDPGLAKPAYLAAKLAEYPVQSEVEALDYYIDHFVWGGLQRTTDETYQYGIYGIQDWKRNRDSDDDGPDGKLHIWRCYDYPHIILMYYHMYQVAKNYPHIVTKLAAEEYLVRAHGTAAAFFTLPLRLRNWSPYGTGYYNELVIPKLLDALKSEGMADEARKLRRHWEKKVDSFVGGRRDLFESEYPFDSTGFESTHVLAKYALEYADSQEEAQDTRTKAKAEQFMDTQIRANLFCRGWLEPAFYLLGSDYRSGGGDRYTLSYMSQMGGWSVLDYGLNHADHADPYLRLGYASYLSAWALVNSGTPKSDYGYWFPGPENDGAAGGGFEPAAFGTTWLSQPHERGSWYYACEIDLGFCGALRTAATLLADDDIFGRFCYGGDWREVGEYIEVTPKDGLRRRFYGMLDEANLQMTLSVDQFLAESPIRLKSDFSEIQFRLETVNLNEHTTLLQLIGLPAGTYTVKVGDRAVAILESSRSERYDASIELKIPAGETSVNVLIKRSED